MRRRTPRGTIYVYLTMVLSVAGVAAVGGLLVRTTQLSRSTDLVDLASTRAGVRAALEIGLARSVDEHPDTVAALGMNTAMLVLDATRSRARFVQSDTTNGPALAEYELQAYSVRGRAASSQTLGMFPLLGIDEDAALALAPDLFLPLSGDGNRTKARELVSGSGATYSRNGIGIDREDGNFAPGLELDGSSNSVAIAAAPAMQSDERTVAMWAMVTDTPSELQTLYSEMSPTLNRTTLYLGFFGKRMTVYHEGVMLAAYSPELDLEPGEWFHVAYTTERGAQRLYVNGDVVWSAANSFLYFPNTSVGDIAGLVGTYYLLGSLVDHAEGSVAALHISGTAWDESRVRAARDAVAIDLRPEPGSFRWSTD